MDKLDNNPYNYPIYIGPLYMCCHCKTMYISEEFLIKHQKKCILMHIFSTSKFDLNGFALNDDIDHSTNNVHEYESNKLSCKGKLSQTKKQKSLKKKSLDFHSKGLSGKTLHECTECLKRFRRKSQLKTHILIHTGEKPFECSLCAKSYSDKANLRRHLRLHKGVKPFKCTECSKSFSLKTTLNQHLLTHASEKPFGCPNCTKTFSRRFTLLEHLMVHTGEKYMCTHCPKEFAQKAYLNTHLKQKHS